MWDTLIDVSARPQWLRDLAEAAREKTARGGNFWDLGSPGSSSARASADEEASQNADTAPADEPRAARKGDYL